MHLPDPDDVEHGEEAVDGDPRAGFLRRLADGAVLGRLAELHESRRQRPEAAARLDGAAAEEDPPVVGDIGLLVARRFGVPLLVISQDVFPEIAERVKRLENPVVLYTLRRLVALYLRRADRVVAIGETMKLRLEQKGAPAERVAVIPNWVDTTELLPQPRKNAWSREQGVDDAFVVMHSGNVGHAQDLDTLIRAQLDARAAARAAKDWTTADAIRDTLAAAGVVVEDSADGARWSLQ